MLAIDQGTSSTKALVLDGGGAVVGRAAVPVARRDPQLGWVEQDAREIRESVVAAVAAAVCGRHDDVVAVGLANQRESAVVWDRRSGDPLGPVLGWQDRRTAARATERSAAGWDEIVCARTGLPLDPMFSALKIEWLLDQVDPDRSACRRGEIAVGTIDSYLATWFTGEHRIETGNASRTQLLNIQNCQWDDELLEMFRIPHACLPRIASSDEPTDGLHGVPGLRPSVRIHGVLGDSHAALYAYGVRSAGQVKVTYGTGSSIMGLIGPAEMCTPGTASPGPTGLSRTIAWATDAPVYAAEGTILSTGATLVWLSGVLGVDPARLGSLAESTADSRGVDLVPAFAGLGAPWWDENAVAAISGLGLGTTAAHIARAAFESVVLQTEDVLAAMDELVGTRVDTVLADGGPTANSWLMQLQADLSQRRVVRSAITELSACGVAYLAGLGAGLWSATDQHHFLRGQSSFEPAVSAADASGRRSRWHAAVRRSLASRSADPPPNDDQRDHSRATNIQQEES